MPLWYSSDFVPRRLALWMALVLLIGQVLAMPRVGTLSHEHNGLGGHERVLDPHGAEQPEGTHDHQVSDGSDHTHVVAPSAFVVPDCPLALETAESIVFGRLGKPQTVRPLPSKQVLPNAPPGNLLGRAPPILR